MTAKRLFCAAVATSALASGGCDRGGGATKETVAPQAAVPARIESQHSSAGEQVTATLTLKPWNSKPGDSIQLKLLLEVKPGRDIGTLDSVPESSATRLTLQLPAELEAQGKWQAPVAGRSLLSDGHAAYSGQVEFTRTLVVKRDAAMGDYQVQCRVDYQVCDDRQCVRPAPIDLVVNVKIE